MEHADNTERADIVVLPEDHIHSASSSSSPSSTTSSSSISIPSSIFSTLSSALQDVNLGDIDSNAILLKEIRSWAFYLDGRRRYNRGSASPKPEPYLRPRTQPQAQPTPTQQYSQCSNIFSIDSHSEFSDERENNDDDVNIDIDSPGHLEDAGEGVGPEEDNHGISSFSTWDYSYHIPTNTHARPAMEEIRIHGIAGVKRVFGVAIFLGLIPILGPILYSYLTYQKIYRPLLRIKICRSSRNELQQSMQFYLFLDLMLGLFLPFIGPAIRARYLQPALRMTDEARTKVLEHGQTCYLDTTTL
ncbi:hypothetical protein BG004_004770 [Podila humilis]|nr:hypothetical protein BG004_004770 [Podila humilis]